MEEVEAVSVMRAAGILFLSIGSYSLWGLFYSLQPPFYPQEAESKGATPSQYSFVFGIAYFASLLASPFFAQYGHHMGPKWLFLLGSLSQASVCVTFGFLHYIEDTTLFLALSYTLRFIYGVVDAGASAGAMAILMSLFSTRIAFLLSCAETAFGLGYTIGPAVGGLLYAWGGFQLPFISLGLLGLVFGFPIIWTVPNLQSKHAFNAKSDSDSDTPPVDIGIWKIVKNPDIIRPMLVAAFFFGGLGVVESLLSPHLEASGASALQVSLNFALLGICYMVAAPICGYVLDHTDKTMLISLLGSLLSFVGFLFIGPSPFLVPLVGEANPTLILSMSSLLGICQGIVVPITFIRCKAGVTKMGCEENIRTHLRISGIWFSSFYLGNSFGPLVGGFLVEWVGFPWAIGSFGWAMLIIAAIDILCIQHDKRGNYQPLSQ